MTTSDPRTLSELLELCSSYQSSQWESGWNEFLGRYKGFIYSTVTRCCTLWNMPRLHHQFSDTVNDIVSDVFMILCRDRCRALRQFEARDSEPRFLAWLAMICKRATGRYIQKYFSKKLFETSPDSFQPFFESLPQDQRWELHETLVFMLRQWQGSRKKNGERDILLFQLVIMADFSPDMIGRLPCFRHLGHRVLDNVIHRVRSGLRSRKPYFIDRL
ncbi:hypothetical protein JW948_13820 [bacterium]|nr:hypothetical protein [bacterium]